MNPVSNNIAGAGLQVGEYLLDSKVGQTPIAELWRAHHKVWADHLAAAKIPTDLAYVRLLQSDGVGLHRLSHPNIVRVLGFDPTSSPPYLITEWVNGPSLKQLLGRGPLPLTQAIAIMKQILAGLAYAHDRSVVHGDLKPANVLIQADAEKNDFATEGSVKLTDFGIGATAAGDRVSAGASLAYIAPEQREGAKPDARSDLYSCGVMLFELLTGDRPAGTEQPSELNPTVPPVMDEVFRRACARRDRRFGSAQDFLALLTSAAAGIKAAPPPAPPAPVQEDIIAIRPDDTPEEPPQSRGSNDVPVQMEPAVPPPEAAPSAPKPPPPRGLVIIDEIARRPMRTADELRAIFRKVYLTRDLEAAEITNLRLRLDSWAESIGGMPGFGERIEVTNGLDCPYHRVIITTQYESDAGGSAPAEQAVLLANPAASQDCGQALASEDFSTLVHLSTGAFPPLILETIPVPPIRMAVANLLNAARSQAAGRHIVKQDLKVARANVLSLRYLYEGAEHGACFAGISLNVVAPKGPVTKMRDDLLKRAASLLDTQNIGAGINELRLMFETTNTSQPRAERMLIAVRAKLSAAYMSLAKATAANMGVFESLEYSAAAADLLPSNEQIPRHEAKARKLAFWIHAGPGMVIGIVFALIAYLNRPLHVGYVAAAVGAVLAGLAAWYTLRTRVARTDVAFCHACVLSICISGILASTIVDNGPSRQVVSGYVVCAILLLLTIVADRLIFRNYGYWLLRPIYRPGLNGSPLDVLNQIQTMLEPDWEQLSPHYVSLDPLYRHASAKLDTDEPTTLAPPAMDDAEPNLNED